MVKIAIITAGLLPVPSVKGGAVETLINQLINENEIEKKLNITVFSIYENEALTLSKKYKQTKFEFVKVNRYLDKLNYYFSRLIWKIFRIKVNEQLFYLYKVLNKIKKYQFDKIIIENNLDFILPISRKYVNDIYMHIHNDYLNVSINKRMEILKHISKTIAVSDFISNKVLEIEPEVNNDVVTLKNCTDISLFDKRLYEDFREKFRKAHGIAKDDIVFLYSGRIHPTKGIKELIIAFKQLNTDNNNKLLIVGSTWYGCDLRDSYIDELVNLTTDMKDRIFFTGYVAYNEMPMIHAASDIAVIPSMWEEPAGLVVLEAMSSGLPIIATDSGGIWEYTNDACAIKIQRDENITNSLANAMNLLSKNRKLRSSMGKNGRRRAAQFSIKEYYNNFWGIIIDK